MSEGWLIARRVFDWEDVSRTLTGFSCAWADLDGWHESGCPATEPDGCVQIWAWANDRVAIVRLGAWRPVVAELRLSPPDPADAAESVESVQFGITRTPVWVDGDKGVRVPTSASGYEVLTVQGVMPLSFVRPAQ